MSTNIFSHWNIEGKNYHIDITSRKGDQGVISSLATIWGQSKGASNLFGVLKNGSNLVESILPEDWSSWNQRVGKECGVAKSWLSIPYSFRAVQECCEKPTFRNGLEMVSVNSLAVKNLFDNPLAKTVGSFGSALKTVVNVIDGWNEWNHYQLYNKLLGEVSNKNGSKETQAGLESLIYKTGCKVAKCFLGFLTGLASFATFPLGVTLPPHIATAALIASMTSGLLGFTADYSQETALWQAKVALLQSST